MNQHLSRWKIVLGKEEKEKNNTISKWETDERRPNDARLVALQKIVGLVERPEPLPSSTVHDVTSLLEVLADPYAIALAAEKVTERAVKKKSPETIYKSHRMSEHESIYFKNSLDRYVRFASAKMCYTRYMLIPSKPGDEEKNQPLAAQVVAATCQKISKARSKTRKSQALEDEAVRLFVKAVETPPRFSFIFSDYEGILAFRRGKHEQHDYAVHFLTPEAFEIMKMSVAPFSIDGFVQVPCLPDMTESAYEAMIERAIHTG